MIQKKGEKMKKFRGGGEREDVFEGPQGGSVGRWEVASS